MLAVASNERDEAIAILVERQERMREAERQAKLPERTNARKEAKRSAREEKK